MTNGTGIGSTEFHVFRSNGAIEPEYLWRFVRQQSFREKAKTVMSGAVGQQRVPADYLRDHVIPLPPLLEQRRIVSKVDALIARSALARKELDCIPTLIANYKQQVLALAAEGNLTSKWRVEHNAAQWARTSVAEIAETTFDGPFGSNLKSADYVKSGVRVVRLENIGRLHFVREKETYISKAKFTALARHQLKPEDVLFSSFIADEIRVCLFPDDLDTAAINKADCFCVRVDRQRCLPKFLAFRLASPTCYEVLKEAVHGATRPRISLKHLKQFEIDLPSLKEQAEIVRLLESAFGWLDRVAADHSAASKMLAKLDEAILAKAFRGELIPQDPNDEPATVLLSLIQLETKTEPSRRGQRSDGPVLETPTKVRDGVTRPRRVSKGQNVSKNRQDDDVFGKPYLASLIKKGRGKSTQELFKAANLPVPDFYKQLAWEIEQKYIRDHGEKLEAA
ncbi:restriction endonuclease subunit S [Rhizobium phaseoli]|uniref:restriction endonuclease subunit S n=1 Tax=Rhizobium phaseoli TaxID=396 RepID=UPI00035E3779|nr:restriction endonuclease subunit S [Rhizobium phaseoli]KKZ84832.1 Type I restriction-modification (R-M) system protein, DNA specificity domain [Rhizobium phaseoli Ch24-10]